jgi:hypothetical protein
VGSFYEVPHHFSKEIEMGFVFGFVLGYLAAVVVTMYAPSMHLVPAGVIQWVVGFFKKD